MEKQLTILASERTGYEKCDNAKMSTLIPTCQIVSAAHVCTPHLHAILPSSSLACKNRVIRNRSINKRVFYYLYKYTRDFKYTCRAQ